MARISRRPFSKGFHSPRLSSLRLARAIAPCRLGRALGVAGFSVVEDSRIQRAEERLVGGGIVNSPCHRDSVFDETDGDAELRNAFDELRGALGRVDDTD